MSEPKIPCMILCGGNSRRFEGGNKELAQLQEKPLLSHVIDRLVPQCGYVAINAMNADLYRPFGLPVVGDVLDGQLGPLAGIHAAMVWAKKLGYNRVLTCGNDIPFLPTDWASRLGRNHPGIVISQSQDRDHYICASWPVSLVNTLEKDLLNGMREVGKWLKTLDVLRGNFELTDGMDPFFNVNTREDLKQAEQMLHGFILP